MFPRRTRRLTPMATTGSLRRGNHYFQLQTPDQRPGGRESDILSFLEMVASNDRLGARGLVSQGTPSR